MYFNVELENNCLGTIILDNSPGRFDLMRRIGVNENTFSTETNRRLFRVINELLSSGLTPDPVTIMSKDSSLSLTVANITVSYTEPWNFEENIVSLRNMEGARAFKMLAGEAMEAFANPAEVISAITIENTVREIDNTIASIAHNRTERTIIDAADEALARMDRIVPPLPLFPDGTIAHHAFKFFPGETMTLAARTGRGKTVLGCQFCINMLSHGLSGIYLCTESTDAEIIERLAAVDSGVPHYAVRGRNRLPEDADKFVASINKFKMEYQNKLTILGLRRKKPNADDVVRAIKAREVKFGQPDFLIVDFIQDLGYSPLMKRMNKLERMEETVDIIHDCCIEHSCAVIFLSQLNRTGQPGERPTEDQIKSASAIAEKSHIAAFLHRPGGEDEDAEFYSIKCRNTKMFDLRLKWERTKYVSPQNDFIPKHWQPPS